jgi:hypothetical protein
MYWRGVIDFLYAGSFLFGLLRILEEERVEVKNYFDEHNAAQSSCPSRGRRSKRRFILHPTEVIQ